MKKLLLTGGAGFVGHHVIDYFLKNTDYDIISLDRLDFSGNLNRIHEILKSHSDEDKKRVKEVIAFVKQKKGLEYAEQKMVAYQHEALELLKKYPESAYKTALELMVNYVIERKK